MVLKQKDGSAPIHSDIQLPDGQFRQITITVTPVERCSMSSFKKNITVTLSGYVRFDFEISANCSLLIEVCVLPTVLIKFALFNVFTDSLSHWLSAFCLLQCKGLPDNFFLRLCRKTSVKELILCNNLL